MRILTIADLHVGCISDTDYFFSVITDIFDKELNQKKTDAVVFLGDYFDRLFKANDEYIALAIDIMSYLTTICRKNRIKIRMVYGTESHEMSQYQLFRPYLNRKDLDVRVIETATEEELSPGVRVLYLPEEYVTDKSKFYDTFFNDEQRYDYIFGHGIVEEGWPTPLGTSPSAGKEKHVPRFKSKELLSSGKLVLMGHYHCRNQFYLGSLFRWRFGEEEPKGYGIIEDDLLTFVENERAYVYRTYDYQADSEIFNGIDKLEAELAKLKADNSEIFAGTTTGKVRLKLNLPADVDPSFTEALSGLTGKDKRLTVTAVGKTRSLNDEIADTADIKYAYILDKSLPIADKIYRYISDEYPESDLTAEDVKTMID